MRYSTNLRTEQTITCSLSTINITDPIATSCKSCTVRTLVFIAPEKRKSGGRAAFFCAQNSVLLFNIGKLIQEKILGRNIRKLGKNLRAGRSPLNPPNGVLLSYNQTLETPAITNATTTLIAIYHRLVLMLGTIFQVNHALMAMTVKLMHLIASTPTRVEIGEVIRSDVNNPQRIASSKILKKKSLLAASSMI